MTCGWTMADVPHRVSWRALAVMVRHAGRDSALYRVVEPALAAWSVGDYLAAMSVDLLSILIWQKTRDGQRGSNTPEPLPRPGDTPKRRQFGDAAMTVDQADAFLARRRAGQLR